MNTMQVEIRRKGEIVTSEEHTPIPTINHEPKTFLGAVLSAFSLREEAISAYHHEVRMAGLRAEGEQKLIRWRAFLESETRQKIEELHQNEVKIISNHSSQRQRILFEAREKVLREYYRQHEKVMTWPEMMQEHGFKAVKEELTTALQDLDRIKGDYIMKSLEP